MKLTLIPYGGLANRMKALEALIVLTRDTTDLYSTAIWYKDKGLNCSFDQLFRPLEIPRLTLREANLLDYVFNDRPRKKNFFIPNIFQKIYYDTCLHEDEVTQKTYRGFDFQKWVLSYKKTFMSACLQFHKGETEKSFTSFIPIDELQKKINNRCKDFSSKTIGVHIRRTDNRASIKNSPTELFIQLMRDELEMDKSVLFYLASDSQEEKERLTSIFGDRIITFWEPVLRHTSQGVQDALVDLYVLSRTQKIIGSSGSSFSVLASEIGNIPYVKVEYK